MQFVFEDSRIRQKYDCFAGYTFIDVFSKATEKLPFLLTQKFSKQVGNTASKSVR